MKHDTRVPLGSAIGALGAIVAAAALVSVRGHVAAENVALLLVLFVLLGAVIGGRPASVVSAVAAALAFDFFHTQPYNSLKIAEGKDIQTMVLLLAVGLAVGEIAASADRIRTATRVRRNDLSRLHRVAEFAASGQAVADLISALQAELIETLHLQDARYEGAPFSRPLPLVEVEGVHGGTLHRYTREGFELPREESALVVTAGGQVIGRFVLTPTPGAGVSPDQRLVAVTLADQLGVVLSSAATGS